FTLQRGWIKISIASNKSSCTIEVADSGVGMSADEIKRILNKKPIESTSGTGGEKGTGLGLKMSLELLERNNCSVNILSKIGEGTNFELKIPLSPKTTN
ncbi:MAG: ATP-binding protein, partial [Cyclobacteriaceae bacterium]